MYCTFCMHSLHSSQFPFILASFFIVKQLNITKHHKKKISSKWIPTDLLFFFVCSIDFSPVPGPRRAAEAKQPTQRAQLELLRFGRRRLRGRSSFSSQTKTFVLWSLVRGREVVGGVRSWRKPWRSTAPSPGSTSDLVKLETLVLRPLFSNVRFCPSVTCISAGIGWDAEGERHPQRALPKQQSDWGCWCWGPSFPPLKAPSSDVASAAGRL